MSIRAVFYVTRGRSAFQEAAFSIGTLREHSASPIYVATDQPQTVPTSDMHYVHLPENCDRGGRLAKLSLFDLVPASVDQVLYIDADTRVHGSLDVGFQMLDAGWDMVITPSQHQGADCMWHIGDVERSQTCQWIANPFPLALQAGVFWVKRNRETVRSFEAWRLQWEVFRDQDQAALLRSFIYQPLRVALLGRCFNGALDEGQIVISHRYGILRGSA